MISFVGCSDGKITSDGIYNKIHADYYDIKSYDASCSIATFTKAGKNTYKCKINYDNKENTYTIASDDMKIFLTNEKCIISKGKNTIESVSSKEDMYIFVNTFFKSYYECEDTAISVNTKTGSDLLLLECSVINPSQYASSMKLWMNKKTVKPEKMQVIDCDGAINTEVVFTDFEFVS